VMSITSRQKKRQVVMQDICQQRDTIDRKWIK
jgi:hypothetical protein